MNDHQSSTPHPLKLTACDCGNIQVTYKSITLHFDREEFFQYASAITHFLCKMRMTPSMSPLVTEQHPVSFPGYLEIDKDFYE